ncbi:protein NASP homolog isoform X2 [Toxorhynchites rutilus septentrionalis]|nr:protein NASP homolog isoform X2 [Toxorhynchites rutilus septentrionalis]XP_055637119.1 protein NASP homolog isoform X2 [Toxorhynchites rutilus septentrionalis]XP_055637121.1 protein NASP homolog isoform X2 [Toxorhynchites rutilus septentrionalis]XP_055637122.1 protein NASP homolog isoform X2 [Toxorhynchites rutilus septentrionalis]
MAEMSESLVTTEDKLAEAKELFGRGSRNYCMKQYMDAADDLSSCCAIYSELYGATAEQCGLPYLLYAKSLIAIGKDENNLIVPGEEEEADDEDDEDGEGGDEGGSANGQVDDEEKKDGEEKATDDAEVKQSEEEQCSKSPEEDDSKKEDGEAGSSSKTDEEPQPGPSTSNGAEEEKEEESVDCEDEKAGGNLEVAWEILELAVKIFESQGDKTLDNLSDCYSELASISFENSHFTDAANDYKKALSIHDKSEKSDSRVIAEIHYKVGLCHLMLNEFEDSIKSFRDACSELDKVIEKEKAKEQTDETEATVEDLEETKQEILDKITEVEETKKTSIEEVKRELSKIIVKGETSNGFDAAGSSSSSTAATNGASSSSKPTEKATDISHLIKRKKPDTPTTNDPDSSPAKKVAVDANKTDV